MSRIQRLYKKKFAQMDPKEFENLPNDMKVVWDNLAGHGDPAKEEVKSLPDEYNDMAEGLYSIALRHMDGSPVVDTVEAVQALKSFYTGVGRMEPDDQPHGIYLVELPFHFVRESGGGTHELDAGGYILNVDFGDVDTDDTEHAQDELGSVADVNVIDENGGLPTNHQLSLPSEYPAGEGDSSQNTRPGLSGPGGRLPKIEGAHDERSAILALIPTDVARKAIAAALGDRLHEAPEDLHITLAYLGKGLSDEDISKVESCLDSLCPEYDSLNCRMQGLGVFDHEVDGGRPFYASVDALGMAKLRTDLMEAIEHCGVKLEKKYDFTPHMTLGYIDVGLIELAEGSPGVEWVSDKVILMNGDKHTEFKLGSHEKEAQIKPQDLKGLDPVNLVMIDGLMEEGFEPSAPSGEQVYDQLRDKQQGVRTNEYLSGPISTFSGEVYVMRQPSSQVYIYVESAIGFVIETGAQSWQKYDVRKDNITPVIRKIDFTASIDTNGVIKPSKSEIEIAEYLALYVDAPMDAFNQTQIGGELRRILRFASRQAGGFGFNLTELGEPSVGGNFEQPDNELSENTQEDPDLKLGEVEKPYSIDSGPENFRFEDDDQYNIVKGAELEIFDNEEDWAAKTASVGNIVRILGFPKDIAERIHGYAPYADMALAKMLKFYIATFGGNDPNEESGTNLNHVLDMMLSDIGTEEFWTALNKPQLPKWINKLPNQVSFTDVQNLIEEAIAVAHPSKLDAKDALITFPDGFYWTPVSEEECKIEGMQMQHCGVPQGQMYSLRDANNKPHVTADIGSMLQGGVPVGTPPVESEAIALLQLSGKQNSPPNNKYLPYVKELVSKMNVTTFMNGVDPKQAESLGLGFSETPEAKHNREIWENEAPDRPYDEEYERALADVRNPPVAPPPQEEFEPEKQAIGLPDNPGSIDSYGDDYGRQDLSIPRDPAKRGPIYGR